MKSFHLAFQPDSPRVDTKPTNYQPKLICGGLLPLLVTPSMHSNVKVNSKITQSCPPTPLLTTNSPSPKRRMVFQTRPQSAMFRQQQPLNPPTNEIPCFGEESLLGYVKSISEFEEWADEPIEMHREEKARPKLNLGLQGNPVCYSPRSKIRIVKNRPKLEPEPNTDTYRFIPDSSKEYLLQDKSLHSIRPENLLGKQATRRTMDFVLVGQKKELKKSEEPDRCEKKLYQKAFQTMDDITKKETVKPKDKITKSETMQSFNVARVDLKIDEDSKNRLDSPRQLRIIIPLPALPPSDTKRKNLIGRSGIRRFGLSSSVKPNSVPPFDTFEWHRNRGNMLKGNAFQYSNCNIQLSRPHSVIA